jgi:predicted DNA-binding protein with PD1-like motif
VAFCGATFLGIKFWFLKIFAAKITFGKNIFGQISQFCGCFHMKTFVFCKIGIFSRINIKISDGEFAN